VAQSTGTKWLTVEQVADELEVGRRTIHGLIDKGAIPGYKVGRVIRIKRADMDAYLESIRIPIGGLDNLVDPGQRLKKRSGTKS
jgi:putative molybdopterin biosynthesis protein